MKQSQTRLNMRMKLIVCIFALSVTSLFASESVSLEGKWRYRLDRKDEGTAKEWYLTNFSEELTLPGSLNLNGIGDEVDVDTPWTGSIWNKVWYESDFYAKYREKDDTKVAFWLTPDKFYVGVAWYQKSVTVANEWQDKEIFLNLERCHWETTLWVDGKMVEMQNALATPHRYNIGRLSPGDHTITLKVDNRVKDINPGADSHSISDNTQSNWNGVVGDISLEARPSVYIKSVKIDPIFSDKKISAVIDLSSSVDSYTKGSITLQAREKGEDGKVLKELVSDIEILEGDRTFSLCYDMSESFKRWDEFNPNLYDLTLTLDTKYGKDSKVEQFGLRELDTKGTQITINGRPVFFRGTLECCIFPKTGFPPTDIQEWERIMNVCKAHGLNHIRFHSWCPPRAAFEAADKLGMYLYVECSSWCSNLGDYTPIDDYIMEESDRIVKEYGNHPSFCLFAYGNEPHGKNHVAYLRRFVKYWKAKDDRFLYNTASGWASIEENDWSCLPAPRIQGWAQGLKSIINAQSPNSEYNWSEKISKTQPVISHEIGQWCVYPNLEEREKYDGVFKAKNFDIFEDRLRDNGLLHLAKDFLMASGKLQTLCYKADIEAALRTKDFGGFQLLDLHDFPGQGSALVGVLDPFWDSKCYVTPEEYSEFCNEVVPLAKMKKFVYSSGETINIDVEVAQFSQNDILNGVVEWKIIDAKGSKLYGGSMAAKDIKTGALSSIGSVQQVLSVKKPEQLQLVLSLNNYVNRWNIWVYPNKEVSNRDVLVTSKLSDEIVQKLKSGAKVLLTPEFGTMRNEGADSVAVGFSSIFWNTMWTNGQAPHTFGVLCDNSHPALKLFPTSSHSDYQWWDALSHCNAIPLHKLGKDIDPIVRIIDDWFTARSLAMVVEVKIGKGKMIICSADLLTDKENRLEARQMERSLLNYMQSGRFNPAQEVTIEQVKSLLK